MLCVSICLPSWDGVWVGGLPAILCFPCCPGLVMSTDLLQLGLVRQKWLLHIGMSWLCLSVSAYV